MEIELVRPTDLSGSRQRNLFNSRMDYYYDKIDEYGAIAEEALAEIPLDIEENQARKEYWEPMNRYEDCVNLIKAIRAEAGISEWDYP